MLFKQRRATSSSSYIAPVVFSPLTELSECKLSAGDFKGWSLRDILLSPRPTPGAHRGYPWSFRLTFLPRSCSFLAQVGEQVPIGAGSVADSNTTGDRSASTPLLWCPKGPYWNMNPEDICILSASTATLCMNAGASLNPLWIASWEHSLEQFSKAGNT